MKYYINKTSEEYRDETKDPVKFPRRSGAFRPNLVPDLVRKI